MFGALYDERELPAEEVHVRLLERLERCGVAVGHGAERACAAHLEAYLARVRRKRIAILVHDAYVYVAQILTVGGDPASVGRKFYAVGLAGRADALLGGGTSLRIVCHDAQLARFVTHVVPHQTIARERRRVVLVSDALTLAVEEELGRGV